MCVNNWKLAVYASFVHGSAFLNHYRITEYYLLCFRVFRVYPVFAADLPLTFSCSPQLIRLTYIQALIDFCQLSFRSKLISFHSCLADYEFKSSVGCKTFLTFILLCSREKDHRLSYAVR